MEITIDVWNFLLSSTSLGKQSCLLLKSEKKTRVHVEICNSQAINHIYKYKYSIAKKSKTLWFYNINRLRHYSCKNEMKVTFSWIACHLVTPKRPIEIGNLYINLRFVMPRRSKIGWHIVFVLSVILSMWLKSDLYLRYHIDHLLIVFKWTFYEFCSLHIASWFRPIRSVQYFWRCPKIVFLLLRACGPHISKGQSFRNTFRRLKVRFDWSI